MNFLILGGTGYLGSKLIHYLLQDKDNHIICIKRKESSLERLLSILDCGRLSFWDVNEAEDLHREWKGAIDWFINCSCRYCRGDVTETEIMEANFLVPLRFFMLCREYGEVRKFLTIDTGLPADLNLYCKAKNEFARLGRWYAETEDLKPIVFYNVLLENFYGEDEPKERFLHYVIDKLKKNEEVLLTEGDQHRDFIYIEDVIEMIGMLLNRHSVSEQRGYFDVPLGTGEGPTIREMVEWLRDTLQSQSVLKFGAVPKRRNEPDSIADIDEMGKFGIKIRYPWKVGMLKLLI